MDQYAVIGNPVKHSRSPQIHQLFAHQTGHSLEYSAIHAQMGTFEQVVSDFQNKGGKGLNITVPFKQNAWDYASKRGTRALLAGAANTLIFDDGEVVADNTDGTGLVNDLVQNHRLKLNSCKILVLGAGGAVRGVLEPILECDPATIVVANRTVEKAISLGKKFCHLGEINGCGYEDLTGQTFDLVINGTAASLQGDLPPLPDNVFSDNAMAYDMMYAPEPTTFMTWASQQTSGSVVDGLGMLVEQAAESFYLWHKVHPLTHPVIRMIRQSMTQAAV